MRAGGDKAAGIGQTCGAVTALVVGLPLHIATATPSSGRFNPGTSEATKAVVGAGGFLGKHLLKLVGMVVGGATYGAKSAARVLKWRRPPA